MALANMGFKDQKLVSFGRGTNSEGRRREEEEEEEKRKKEESSQGMETNLDYGFYEIMYEFSMLGWLVACSQTWGFARVSS